MKIHNLILFYITLLIFHALHVIEEALGGAPFINTIFNGLINFLIIGILLFLIPLSLLYFILKGNKIAYNLSYIYAIIMVIDGSGHLISFLSNKDYLFTSIAGAYTGTGLVIFGILLFYSLKKSKLLYNDYIIK